MGRGKILAAVLTALAVVGATSQVSKAATISYTVSQVSGGTPFSLTAHGVVGAGYTELSATDVPVAVTVIDGAFSGTYLATLDLTAYSFTPAVASGSTIYQNMDGVGPTLGAPPPNLLTLTATVAGPPTFGSGAPVTVGENLLTAFFQSGSLMFDDDALSGKSGHLSLDASTPGDLLSFTSDLHLLQAPEDLGLTFSSLSSPASIGASGFLNDFSAVGAADASADIHVGAVPLPAAAWSGLTSLAGLALLGILRKRARLA